MEEGTPPPSLTRDRDFLKFWTGQAISVFGSQFSGVAVPIIAFYFLNAGPIQFGILGFLGSLAFLLFSLLVGVYVDRHRRKMIMIYADIGRASVIAVIPICWFLGLLNLLSMNLLYAVVFVSGVLTVFFEISYQSYVPSLVQRSQLVDANGKLETTRAISQSSGPAVAGFLVGIVSAPIVIVGDVLGFLASAASLSWIKKAEAKIEKTSRSTFHDVREGVHVVVRDRRLWQIAGCTSTANLFAGGIGAITVPYLATKFSLDKATAGIWIGSLGLIGALGSILGAQTAARMAKRIGVGPAIIVNSFLFGLPTIGFYFGSGQFAFLVFGASSFITGFGAVGYNVNQVSYRQALVPLTLQGRMNATMRFIVTGTVPIGSLFGGILGQVYGYQSAIGICAAGVSFAFLWILLSPIRGVKKMPAPEPQSAPSPPQTSSTA